MLEHIARFWRTSVMGTFLTGVLFLLPVALTIYIVAWIIDLVRVQLGPGTLLGRLLTSVGGGIVGTDQNVLAFTLGLLIALTGIWAIGVAVKTQAKSMIQENIDRTFARVPLIRSIYNPVSRVVRMATKQDGGDFSGMSVVTCRFGGAGGADVLALLASREVFMVGGERRRLVYLPTAPIPMSGGLVLVPEHAVILVPEMKVDDLLKIYVSLGALTAETLPKQMVVPLPQPAPAAGTAV